MNAHSRLPTIQKSGGRLRPATHVERALVGQYLNAVKRGGVDTILRSHYPDDGVAPLLVRAATDPYTTTNASALAEEAVADYVLSLAPLSAGARLMQSAIRIDVQRRIETVIPTRVVTVAEGGSFTVEGEPLPVIAPALTGVTLAPRKLGAIAVFTRELADRSLRSVESVIGTVFREASALALDAALFSTTAGDTARPAGLFNGITPLTPSALTNLPDAMLADLSALIGAVAAAGGGQSIMIVAAPPQAAVLSLIGVNAAGTFTVLSSAGMAAGTVAATEPSSLAFGFGPEPEIDASKHATLHMSDAPAHIVTAGPTVASPTRSLFQTDSTAVRMILDCAWVRRAPQVAFMTGVGW